jgi:RHS repeat-associated protein
MKATGGTTTVYVYGATGEVAAEYSTTPPPQVGTLYLTEDHLGSTRLETNELGAAVAYHDYLPFGEEIPSPIGGRGSLYGASDGVTHKFTRKERDTETGGSATEGMDYFGARYFSSTQGRFTSADPLGGGLIDPQTLNRYAYVRNNPLASTDPTGMYICKDDPKDGSSHCTSDQDKKFERALGALRGKSGDVGSAAAAYGAAGEDNGVTVGFADLTKQGEGGVTRSQLGADSNGKLYAQSDVTINSGSTGTALAAAIGHEGSHVADAQSMAQGITITGGGTGFTVGVNISQYASEQRAYRVTDAIYRSANEPYNGCGSANCALGAGSSPIGLGQRIDQILFANPDRYHSNDGKPLTQKNQGGNVLNVVAPH